MKWLGTAIEKTGRWLRVEPWAHSNDPSSPESEAAEQKASAKKKETPEKEDPAENGASSDPWKSATLKTLSAIAGAIGLTGGLVAVGAAVIWIRFNQVGIPAMQAVSVQPKYEALAQGVEEVILFTFIALIAVVCVFFADRTGRPTRATLLALTLMVAGAIIYVFLTRLSVGVKFGLAILVLALAAGCLEIGRRTEDRFWPLAVSVFLAALIFSAACGTLIVQQQRFVQAIALLRGPEDAGLTGVYVAATEDRIYFAQPATTSTGPGEESDKQGLFDLAREGVTYAVGPLESEADAELRAQKLLEGLVSNRARNPAAKEDTHAVTEGSEAERKEQEEAQDDEIEEAKGGPPAAGKVAEGGGKPDSGDPIKATETVAKAFESPLTIHREVERPLCLVRYAAAGSVPLGRWWTSCEEAASLSGESLLEIREKLALPSRFQRIYDMRVTAKVPVGTTLVYLEGKVAPQCEHDPPAPCGHELKGGGIQFYIPESQLVRVTETECTETREDLSRPEWEPCEPQDG